MARTFEQKELAMRVTLWVILNHWNLRMLGPEGVARDLPWMYEEIAAVMFGKDASATRIESSKDVNGAS